MLRHPVLCAQSRRLLDRRHSAARYHCPHAKRQPAGRMSGDKMKERLQQELSDCVMTSSWFFCVAGKSSGEGRGPGCHAACRSCRRPTGPGGCPRLLNSHRPPCPLAGVALAVPWGIRKKVRVQEKEVPVHAELPPAWQHQFPSCCRPAAMPTPALCNSLQSYMPVVWMGLMGTLLDLINGESTTSSVGGGRRAAGLGGSACCGATPALARHGDPIGQQAFSASPTGPPLPHPQASTSARRSVPRWRATYATKTPLERRPQACRCRCSASWRRGNAEAVAAAAAAKAVGMCWNDCFVPE